MATFSKFFSFILFTFFSISSVFAEENFLLLNGMTNETIVEMGSNIDERFSPCSTFKIPLSLMGFDAGILKDEESPVWDYHDGFDDFLPSWKAPQTPLSWMTCSCVWYSKILSIHLGLEKMQEYLAALSYGNQDISAGLVYPGKDRAAWLGSTLKISPREQVDFLRKMILENIPISKNAIQITKKILFREELPGEWKLFGRTGYCGYLDSICTNCLEHAWFIGWIEKDETFFPFAYLIREKKIKLEQRIPRVKQLLVEANLVKAEK